MGMGMGGGGGGGSYAGGGGGVHYVRTAPYPIHGKKLCVDCEFYKFNKKGYPGDSGFPGQLPKHA